MPMSRVLASYEEMPRVHIGYSHTRDSAMLNSAIFIGTSSRILKKMYLLCAFLMPPNDWNTSSSVG